MFEIDELFRQISRLKQSKEFVTNSFLLAQDLLQISQENSSCFVWNEEAALLVSCDNGVNRAYIYLASLGAISRLNALAQNITVKPLVVDCVGKAEWVDILSSTLQDAGFQSYAKLSRWKSEQICFISYPFFLDKPFRAAEKEDCQHILNMLYKTFDPYVSHLPSKQKMVSLIEDKLVFCAIKDKKIIAVVCLEKVGKKGIYSYQNVVEKEYRSVGLGSSLLQFAFYQFRECTQYTAWIEDKNIASNRMHKALGMSYDGLKDHVLIFE